MTLAVHLSINPAGNTVIACRDHQAYKGLQTILCQITQFNFGMIVCLPAASYRAFIPYQSKLDLLNLFTQFNSSFGLKACQSKPTETPHRRVHNPTEAALFAAKAAPTI